jgi:hypothetical protein
MRPISRSVVVCPSESFSILKVTFFFSQVPRLKRCTLSASWNCLNPGRFRLSLGPLFRRLLKPQRETSARGSLHDDDGVGTGSGPGSPSGQPALGWWMRPGLSHATVEIAKTLTRSLPLSVLTPSQALVKTPRLSANGAKCNSLGHRPR